jgi:hypothetical protein
MLLKTTHLTTPPPPNNPPEALPPFLCGLGAGDGEIDSRANRLAPLYDHVAPHRGGRIEDLFVERLELDRAAVQHRAVVFPHLVEFLRVLTEPCACVAHVFKDLVNARTQLDESIPVGLPFEL